MDISITTSLSRTYVASGSGRSARVVRVGEPLYLMMPLSGRLVSPPSVQWVRNGTDIPGATETPYIPTDEDVGENVLSARGTLPDGTAFEAQSAVTVREAKGQTSPRPEPRPVPVLVEAPRIASGLGGREVSLDFGSWEDAESLTGTILRDGEVHLSDLAPGATVTWTEADAGASMVLRVEARGHGETFTAESQPVTVTLPLAPPRRIGSLEDEIFDVDSGDQVVETAHVFEGAELRFAVNGANATIDDETGVVTLPTEAALTGVVVTVTASNAAGSDKASFQVTVEDEEAEESGLTPTLMRESVIDPSTGIEYHFVDGTGAPQAREVGRYWNGEWFVLGGAGNPVRIGRITPEGAILDTADWAYPTANQDAGAYAGGDGTKRILNGAEVNPNQGETLPTSCGWDSYIPKSAKGNISYRHERNVDPTIKGAPLVLEEGSVVKSVSVLEDPGDDMSGSRKTMVAKWGVLTVVPEIPPLDAFRPPIRGTDKRSYWSVGQIDWERHRKIVPDWRPLTVDQLQKDNARRKHLQNTWMPFQENARTWNPGAHGHGYDVYGTAWYAGWDYVFRCFHGDYTKEEIEEGVTATIQCGIDLYGLNTDNSWYRGWYAHHAGRKGIMMMAGVMLGDQNILEMGRYSETNNRFGVDDGMSGYVNQDMIDNIVNLYWNSRKRYLLRWQPEHLGLAEWSSYFAPFGAEPSVSRLKTDHILTPDLNRDYQVQSMERTGEGAITQHIWGMILDPKAEYWNPAHFDFVDRYLRIRTGDAVEGAWQTMSSNSVFWGNWHNINGGAQFYRDLRIMRNNANRPWYRSIPEHMPAPQLTETAAGIEVAFSKNDFRCPQHKDIPITRYDLRWIAYPDGALEVTREDSPNRLHRMEWRYENDITITPGTPYLLTGVPGGYRIVVQIRMHNEVGPGPFFDTRYADDYEEGTFRPGVDNYVTGRWRSMFNVSSALARSPINWCAPSFSPTVGIVVGTALTASSGHWTGKPTFEFAWERSADGGSTWKVVGSEERYTVENADGGCLLRLSVRATNGYGTSEWTSGKEQFVTASLIKNRFNLSYPKSLLFGLDGASLDDRHFILLVSGWHDVLGEVSLTVGNQTFRPDVVSGSDVAAGVFSFSPSGTGASQFRISSNIGEVFSLMLYELTGKPTLVGADTAISGQKKTYQVPSPACGAVFFAGRGTNSLSVSKVLTTGDNDLPYKNMFAGVIDGIASENTSTVQLTVDYGGNYHRAGVLASYEIA